MCIRDSSWAIAIPIYSYLYCLQDGTVSLFEIIASDAPCMVINNNYFDAANNIWNTKVRYLGVGAMVVGGIWSVIQLAKPLIESIQLSLKTLKESSDNISLEERDLPINYVFMAIIAMLIPIALTYFGIIGSWTSAIILSFVMLVFGLSLIHI